MSVSISFAFSRGRIFPSRPIEYNLTESELIPNVGDFVTGEIFGQQYKIARRVLDYRPGVTKVTLIVNDFPEETI